MRSRLVIPAAFLMAIGYVKGRFDAGVRRRQAPPLALPAPPPPDPIARAEAEAADAVVMAEAQATATATATAYAERPAPARPLHPSLLNEWVAAPASPVLSVPAPPSEAESAIDAETECVALDEWAAPGAGTPIASAEPVAPPILAAAPALEVVIDESGRFSLGGWAAQGGDMTLSGVTFRDRRGVAVDPSSIRLVTDAQTNVADGGLLVLSDPGFAPDVEGFTILLAAAGPGSFAATGRYEVVAA